MKTTSQNDSQIAGCENQTRSLFYSKLPHLSADYCEEVLKEGKLSALFNVTATTAVDAEKLGGSGGEK